MTFYQNTSTSVALLSQLLNKILNYKKNIFPVCKRTETYLGLSSKTRMRFVLQKWFTYLSR